MSVTSTIGPISGINYGNLITGLTATDQAAIDAITTQTNTLESQSSAFTDLATLMTGLKVSSASFASSAIFRAAAATVANPSILNATAGIGTSVGNYSFNVQRLASASQQVTQGFADANNTPLGLSGTITLQTGGGDLNNVASLSSLNGGSGIARGTIRLTDAAGDSGLIDLSQAVDINDVVNDINSSTSVDVTAKIANDHLVLTDNSGGSGKLTVANAGGTTTASDLGIAGSVTGTLTGSSLTKLSASTNLNSLNDGNGVRTAGLLSDFSITGAAGSVNVSLNTAKTVGDVIKAINTAGQASGITAAISADGSGITLTDSGGGPVSVTAQNGSLAAYDLGILGTGTGGTLTGDRVASSLTGPLLRDLNGGNQGQTGEVLPQPGTITINGQTVDLTSARSLTDVISAINNSGQGITAALDDSGTGLTLSSAAPSFTIADGTGNLASFLHIAGTSAASATGSQISSGDLRERYISQNSLLSSLNGGAGIKPGSIVVTDGTGASQTIDLSSSNITTIGDVISKINNSGLAITAGINSTGDGILLTQTSGTLAAKVQEVGGGGTAASLGIAGTFANNQLNGSFQDSVTILATDKLSDIASKINKANPGVSASIINDGSGATPFRLSITSRNSGTAGQVIFNGAPAGLSTTSLIQGQNAVVVYGGNASGTGGLVSTSSTNNITGLVPGLSLNLTGVGTTSVSVTNDTSQITTAVQGFVDSYNQVVNDIATVTNFDPNNATNNGVLFGDPTIQQVQEALGSFVTQKYSGVGALTNLSSVGITVGQDGTLTLNNSALTSALSASGGDVSSLFTTNIAAVASDFTKTPPVAASPAVKGIGATLSDLIDRFTDAQTGLLFQTTDSISTQEQQLQSRQSDLNALLVLKKNNLVQTFANLEVTISQLQSQGSALSNFAAQSSASASKA